MSIQTNILFKEPPGSHEVVLARITLDNLYPTGGYPLGARDFKAGRIKACGVLGCSGGYQAAFNTLTSCVEVTYPAPAAGAYPAAGAEVSAATDLTGVVVDLFLFVE